VLIITSGSTLVDVTAEAPSTAVDALEHILVK
jgi:hypothetical protein